MQMLECLLNCSSIYPIARTTNFFVPDLSYSQEFVSQLVEHVKSLGLSNRATVYLAVAPKIFTEIQQESFCYLALHLVLLETLPLSSYALLPSTNTSFIHTRRCFELSENAEFLPANFLETFCAHVNTLLRDCALDIPLAHTADFYDGRLVSKVYEVLHSKQYSIEAGLGMSIGEKSFLSSISSDDRS